MDDSEIKEGDWFYGPATKEALYASKSMLSWNSDTTQEHKGWKKITHSTQPLNGNPHYAEYGMLSLQEVKELIGEVDVEKKYTEEDIQLAIDFGFIQNTNNGWIDLGQQKEFIQSLQPKTEWEVEFIDGKLKLIK